MLSDEVYERIIFDGIRHQSGFTISRSRGKQCCRLSFGKTFHATGWKVGYAVAPEHLSREIRKTHQFITFSVNTPVQLAMAEYLTDPDHYLHLGSFYQQKEIFSCSRSRVQVLSPCRAKAATFSWSPTGK